MEDTYTNGESKPDHETNPKVNGSGVHKSVEASVAPALAKSPQTLEELVRAEIEANKLSMQRLCTWGVMGVVCIMCYLAWLHQSVQDNFFNPETVAAFVTGTIDEQLPMILGRTEREVIDDAPRQIEAVSAKVLSAVPEVRKEAEQQIENIYVQMPLLREALNNALRAYFDEHRAQMRDFAEAHQDKEFVRYFTDHVIGEMQREIHSQFGTNDELNLKKVQEQSLAQLVLLNERLEKLAETSPYYMTRRDLVARRLVAVFASMIHESTDQFTTGAAHRSAEKE